MLHKKSWQDNRIILLAIVVIIAFGVVLATRFQRGSTSPSTDTNRSSAQQLNQAESLAPTDKMELPQTETIVVEPSTEVATAEKSLPSAADPSYISACQQLKEKYIADHNAKQAEEDRRHSEAQQSIINSYSAAGMSFSMKQKNAHSAESRRHDSVHKQLDVHLQKQLAGIRC